MILNQISVRKYVVCGQIISKAHRGMKKRTERSFSISIMHYSVKNSINQFQETYHIHINTYVYVCFSEQFISTCILFWYANSTVRKRTMCLFSNWCQPLKCKISPIYALSSATGNNLCHLKNKLGFAFTYICAYICNWFDILRHTYIYVNM